MFGFSSKLILTNIFTQISNNIFSVVLGKFYNPQQLGFLFARAEVDGDGATTDIWNDQ